MGREWYQAHIKLKNFITGHPEIQFSHRVIAIPENVRPEFYRLFNQVRTDFVKEQLPNLPRETKRLKEHYVKADGDVKRLLKLAVLGKKEEITNLLNQN